MSQWRLQKIDGMSFNFYYLKNRILEGFWITNSPSDPRGATHSVWHYSILLLDSLVQSNVCLGSEGGGLGV